MEMKKVISTLAKGFVCELCVDTIKGIVQPGEETTLFDQVDFVKNFCYLRDWLNTSGRSEAAVTARTRIELIKLIKCGELAYQKNFSLKMKGRIY